MKNKWLIIPYSITHFLVDFACALFMFHYAFRAADKFIFVLIYNFCAFALQMPFGLLVDKWNRNALTATIGCLFVAAAYIGRPFLFASVVILGIGNALFHVGAGTDVLNSSTEKASLLGIFVSPGAFGIYFGTLLGTTNFLMFRIYPVILLTAALLILFMDYNKSGSLRSNNVKVSFASASGNRAFLPIICFFLVVVLRSYLGMRKFSWGGQANWGIYLICAVVFGKAMGGILADWFGFRKVAFVSLAASVICFAGSSIPVCGVLGIFFFNMTMPITLWAIAKILEGCKGFSFGLLTVALFLGMLPDYLSEKTVFHTIIGSALIAAVSLVILMAGLKNVKKQVCVVLFCLLGFSITPTVIHADVLINGDSHDNETEQDSVSDNQSFMKIHSEELEPYDGKFANDTTKKKVILWEFPYSTKENGTIEAAFSDLPFQYTYLDLECPDYLWGYIKDYHNKEGWICLNDPATKEISTLKQIPQKQPNSPNVLIVVLILVAALVIGTILLIRMYAGKEEKKE